MLYSNSSNVLPTFIGANDIKSLFEICLSDCILIPVCSVCFDGKVYS